MGGLAISSSAPVHAAQTPFGFTASSYGTRVVGGQLPLNSGKTAQSVLPCTTEAPKTDKNRAAEVNLGALPIDVGAVRTENRSEAITNGFRAFSTAVVDEVLIGNELTGGLRIEGLRATAVGKYVNGVPGPRFTGTFLRATAYPSGDNVSVGEVRQGFDLPGGIATITLNNGSKKTGTLFNSATGNALLIEVHATGSKAVVASAYARIDKLGRRSVFGGGAKVARAVVDNGTARVGPLMNLPMPCLGTSGQWKSESLAKGELEGVGRVKGGRTRVFGEQADGAKTAIAEAYLGAMNLGNGRLRVEGVKARSYTKINAAGAISRKAEGSTIARIVLDGNVIALPDPGQTINLPGVGSLTFLKVRRFPTGIEVIAVRIQLSNGDVVDVASSKTSITDRG